MSIYGGHNRKVSSFISENKWKENLASIPTQIQQKMINIRIYSQMPQDFRSWVPNKDGQFSFNSARNQVRCKHLEFNRTKIIWDKFYNPKMSTCSLLAKLNKLNTKDQISKRIPDINRTCVLYLQHFEERDHLFFQCEYSKNLLKEITQRIQINFSNYCNINHILKFISQNPKSNLDMHHLKNSIFTSSIWHIWCERNSWVFNNVELPSKVRALIILQDCRSLFKYKLDNKLENKRIELILSSLKKAIDGSFNIRPP